MMTTPSGVAVIGSGNIGTALMMKVNLSDVLQMSALVGIDPQSDGLLRAAALGVRTTADGIEGLKALPEFADVSVVFDATSAQAHLANDAALRDTHVKIVDLTPAAIGPFLVPAVKHR